MNHLLAYLFLSGVVLFILGVVLLSSPMNTTGIAGFMVAIGLLLSLGTAGYYIYEHYYKQKEIVQ